MSHKKIGPDRFSRFDVYWIQTNKQTNRQTSQIYIYIIVQLYAINLIEPSSQSKTSEASIIKLALDIIS